MAVQWQDAYVLRATRHRAALALGVAVLLVGAAVGYVLLPPRQSRDVPEPGGGASPEQVVAAYLEALDAHDCATAEAVWTGGEQKSAGAWCDDVASLTNIEIGRAFAERPQWSGHAAPEEVINVGVTFDLDWRLFHDDGTVPQGDTFWGYLLVRDSPNAPWRIFSQGVG